jgi:DNA processing protein
MSIDRLLLALARCAFLTCAEKEFLAKKLDNLESLTVRSIEDICLLVRRRITTRAWKPEILADLVENDLRGMERYGIKAVSILDEGYPPLLRELHDPPFVLYWRGTLPDPEKPVAAIVGTRMPTGSGALAAARFGKEFADSGVPVVSGLARGIDAFAHRGCVEALGKSVAVLACGLDRIYPRSNATLAGRLLESGGCVIGEYPPGEEPLKFRFPERNRIIAGLARSVVVIEAPEKSGALITADFALEQGKDLFVFSGTLDSPRGAGTKRLAFDGAPAVSSAREVLASWVYPARLRGIDFGANTDIPPRAPCSRGSLARQGPEGIGRQLALEFENELGPL